jgi:hypothetical protein
LVLDLKLSQRWLWRALITWNTTPGSPVKINITSVFTIEHTHFL